MEDSRVIVFACDEYYPWMDNCKGIFPDLKTASEFCKLHKKHSNYDFYDLQNLQKYITKMTERSLANMSEYFTLKKN